MALFGPSKKELQQQITSMQSVMTPEQQQILTLQDQIAQLTKQREELDAETRQQKLELSNLLASVQERKAQIIQMDETLLLQEFGLYEPKYDFQNSDEHKNRLAMIRQQQKDMIKAGEAVTGAAGWTVNGNAAQGRKMVADTQKLLLRAFNSECDGVVAKVKYNNFEASLKRISASSTAISKLGAMMQISITDTYYNLKVEEVTLALEYQQKKQQEKEAQKAEKARMREEAKMQREIEESRAKLDKEQKHYSRVLADLRTRLANAGEVESEEIMQRITEAEAKITDVEKAKADVDYREANRRAGYVYIISNIGAFGQDVYKIGMTRRLEPRDRIDELGDASVPFDFDVHAMIFSDDAPRLEAALHAAFVHRKLNYVNQRREFFRVTLDEIKAVVQANYDKIAEFNDVPDAEQYRISEKMRATVSAP